MHNYYIQAAHGNSKAIELSEEEFNLIKSSWDFLSVIVKIEENWDCLIQNYIEFETDIIGTALNFMIRGATDYQESNDTRVELSRRLSNLLQSCRSYLDHTPKILTHCEVCDATNSFEGAKTSAYETNFSYRFMEELRNVAQHRGAPLHGFILSSNWRDGVNGPKTLNEYTNALMVDIDTIRKDDRFKKRVLHEIETQQRQLDLGFLTREYIEGLSQVHENVRKCLFEVYTKSKNVVSGALTKYAVENNDHVLVLGICTKSDNDKSCTNIFADLYKRIEVLTQRNRSLVNLNRRYVTGATSQHKKE